MPVEIIGEFGTSSASLEWLHAQAKLAIRHIIDLCGDPPPEMCLEIVWKEHELGNYPVIALVWDDDPDEPLPEPPDTPTGASSSEECSHLVVTHTPLNQFADVTLLL